MSANASASKFTANKFTGRHMAGVLVVGFGIVAAVNFYMAGLAAGGFHGVVVENSYVASQQFNDWLDEAEASRALGWSADLARDEAGFVSVRTHGVPQDARITADLRRPIGSREYASLTFAALSEGAEQHSFVSHSPVADGRWIIRIYIDADEEHWVEESELP